MSSLLNFKAFQVSGGASVLVGSLVRENTFDTASRITELRMKALYLSIHCSVAVCFNCSSIVP